METIGTTSLPINVSTHAGKMCATGDKTYKAVETGPDTGVFTAQVELTGYSKAVNSGTPTAGTSCGTGNTDGKINTDRQSAGISVSFESIVDTVWVASSAIWWNIGESEFDATIISIGDSVGFTVVDPDENIDSGIRNTFTADAYSDSDQGGLTFTLIETGIDTGIFMGEFFTTTGATSGSNLHVSDGDMVTAEYSDGTLPEPYAPGDVLTISSTLAVGTVIPPLERAPAANVRVVDAFGSSIAGASVGQQVQIAADVSNGQNGDLAFAYIVQVRDSFDVSVSTAWITGSLTATQSMSPAMSWTPDHVGTYTATVFIWESVDNPAPLSPPTSTTITVDGGGSSIFLDAQFEPELDCSGSEIRISGVCVPPESQTNIVSTNNQSYEYGDTIRITGYFENYDGTSHITILVYDPNGNPVAFNQIIPDSNGAFSTYEMGAGKFSDAGTYTVKAYLDPDYYNPSNYYVLTTFEFSNPQAEAVAAAEEAAAEAAAVAAAEAAAVAAAEAAVAAAAEAAAAAAAAEAEAAAVAVLSTAVATFLANNPIEEIDQLPEVGIEENESNIWCSDCYAYYRVGLYWQQHLKPFILQADDPLAMLEVLKDELEPMGYDASQAENQISVYNPDGTENEERKIAHLNAEFVGVLSEQPGDTIRLVNNGMSLQSAIFTQDVKIEKWIEDYMELLNLLNPVVTESEVVTPSDEITPGSEIQIETDIINQQDSSQLFAYIVQISDESGIPLSISTITGSLAQGQTLTQIISWTPNEPGVYVAQIFLWDNLQSPNPLSSVEIQYFTVTG